MRLVFALPLILACGLAAPALAQPAAPTASSTAATGSKVDAVQTPAKPNARDQDAAAALAMAIRQHEAEEQRIARVACAAGDTAKCQLVKVDTTAKTSSP